MVVIGPGAWRACDRGGAEMAKEIDNPCIALCQLSGDLCVSCGRTKDDIRKWKRMKRPEKMAAVQRASARLKALRKKQG